MMKKLFKWVLFLFIAGNAATAHAQNIPQWKIEQLEHYIREAQQPTIINFWATFCKPCIEEIPYFQKWVKHYDTAGIQLLLVSLDFTENFSRIRSFAAKHKFVAPIVFLHETNADYFCPKVDEQWSGALPATLFINNKTGYRNFIEEQIPEKKLLEEIRKLIRP